MTNVKTITMMHRSGHVPFIPAFFHLSQIVGRMKGYNMVECTLKTVLAIGRVLFILHMVSCYVVCFFQQVMFDYAVSSDVCTQ